MNMKPKNSRNTPTIIDDVAKSPESQAETLDRILTALGIFHDNEEKGVDNADVIQLLSTFPDGLLGNVQFAIKVLQTARACHSANRVIQMINPGDEVSPEWSEASDNQRSSAVMGVLFTLHNPEATPENQHEAWLASKRADGWTYGLRKCEERKIHPCMMPYSMLPPKQRMKDELFQAIVRSSFGTVAVDFEGRDSQEIRAIVGYLSGTPAEQVG